MMFSPLLTYKAKLRDTLKLRGVFAQRQHSWDASVSLATGVANGLDTTGSPTRMRLLLDDGQWLESELALPLWMSAHEVRTEVVLHAQSLHDDAAVYVDSIVQPCGQDGMQLLKVWSAEHNMVGAVWQSCQAQYGSGGRKPAWQLVGLAPHSQRHTCLNMLAYREQAAAQYSRASWRLLGFNAVAFTAVVGALGYTTSAPVEVVPAQVVTPRAEAFDVPTVAVLREQLAQVTLAQQQQTERARHQAWQLNLLATLARDMTAHVTVAQLVAKADLVEVHGQARAVADLTGFVEALRARWGYAAHVQLRSSQHQGAGALAYELVIEGYTPTAVVSSP